MFQPIFRVVSKHLPLDNPQSQQVQPFLPGTFPQVISLVFLPVLANGALHGTRCCGWMDFVCQERSFTKHFDIASQHVTFT